VLIFSSGFQLKTGLRWTENYREEGKKKGFAAFASRWEKIEREERGKEIGACMKGNKAERRFGAACCLLARREEGATSAMADMCLGGR
jgi:hypothetical protein